MILNGWFVVAVPIVRCCGVVSMATASTRGRPRVGLSGRSWKTQLAQHTNDKSGSFDVVRFDWDICVLCPAFFRARSVAGDQADGLVRYSFSHVLICL